MHAPGEITLRRFLRRGIEMGRLGPGWCAVRDDPDAPGFMMVGQVKSVEYRVTDYRP